jgi:hypothetical protein
MKERRLAHLAAAALCLVAFSHAWHTTRDLAWPAFDVQYREMAAAQTALDGHPTGDPCYRGESAWYNPMSSWILVAATTVSRAPLPVVTVRIGPFINLLAPVAFYLLALAWLEAWAAVAALGAFLFVSGLSYPFWCAATYSPWFAPENYGQGLFYLALWWAHRANAAARGTGAAIVLGVLLGLAFLVHTAPALLLGGVLLALAAFDVSKTRRLWPALGRLATTLGVALAISAPIAISVIGRYHAHVVNPFPSASPSPLFESLIELAARLVLGTPFAVALVAFAVRLRRGAPELPPVLRASLLAAAGGAVWVGFDVAAARTGVAALPRLPMPAFHFVFYALALAAMGFGFAVGDLAKWGARRLRAIGVSIPPSALAGALLAATLAAIAPAYLRRPDVTEVLEEARKLQAAVPAALYRWLRESTMPEDVVLSTDAESLFVIAPAGRKLVATNRYFSNPFIDWAARDRDRDAMFAALDRNDLADFARLAAPYGVRWIVVPNGLNDDLRRLAGVSRNHVPTLTPGRVPTMPAITRAWADDRYAVFRYDGASDDRPRIEARHP